MHDGFTLRDLVSYNEKHNLANGEANRDGTSDNRSWNCGAEGDTDDPGILALRARQCRAMLATLLLSFGVPLLLGGDEMGRTQLGNNNAYCQDNEMTWLDWASQDRGLLEFCQRVIALRKAHPVFRRRRFLAGADAHDLRWFTPAGSEMTTADWADPNALAILLYLDGCDAPDRAADGTPLIDDDFLVLVNAWWQQLDFVLPPTRPQAAWQLELDSYQLTGPDGPAVAGQAVSDRAGRGRAGAGHGRRQDHGAPPLGRRAAQPATALTPGTGAATARTAPRRSWPRPPTGLPCRAAPHPRTTGSTSEAGPCRRWPECSRCSRPAWSRPG